MTGADARAVGVGQVGGRRRVGPAAAVVVSREQSVVHDEERLEEGREVGEEADGDEGAANHLGRQLEPQPRATQQQADVAGGGGDEEEGDVAVDGLAARERVGDARGRQEGCGGRRRSRAGRRREPTRRAARRRTARERRAAAMRRPCTMCGARKSEGSAISARAVAVEPRRQVRLRLLAKALLWAVGSRRSPRSVPRRSWHPSSAAGGRGRTRPNR